MKIFMQFDLNFCKKRLTLNAVFDIITFAADKADALERYRSGHNEAVLKTVCPQGRVGSNPTLSAGRLRDSPAN